MQHSHNDHYKWGFNDGWFNKPDNGYFKIQLGSCTRPHGTFREECINAARLLGQQTTKPIAVGLSGGHDSQVVCLSLMAAGVPFTPVILRLYGYKKRYYNGYDVEGAFAFCEKHGLTPIVEELNLDEYYSEKLMTLVNEYGIVSAEISVQLHLVHKYAKTHAYINGGGDPILLIRANEDGTQDLTYTLMPLPIQQVMMDKGIEGCLKFFMYTPELIAAYLDHPVMHAYHNARQAIPPKDSYDHFTYCVKAMMYCSEWPELVARKKNTGFEYYPYQDRVLLMVKWMNDWYNPQMKAITWKWQEMLEHLNTGNGATLEWRSIDERDYY